MIMDMGDWAARVNHVLTQAETCQTTSQALNEQIKLQIWEPLNDKSPSGRARYNQFMHGFVTGLVHSRREAIWKMVEFCYLIDGKLYTTSKEATGKPKVEQFYGGDKYTLISKAPNGHVWKGTNKPYFFADRKGNQVDPSK